MDSTVWENLHFISYLYKISNRKKKVAEVIEIFRLQDLQKQRISELSAGQATRVNLAKAFINSPKVLLLDEPTASLDPDIATYIRQLILQNRRQFKTSIIFTSHNMAEVEEICDRVIFINHGQILANDTAENLARTIEWSHIELLARNNLERLMDYCKSEGLKFKAHGKSIIIDIKEKQIAEFLIALAAKKISYDEISIEKPSLEDYFIQNAPKL
jgi:ABC-2 type transport system ATP-binding protein